jgi:UDP-N-acetylglucosamine transferase subunit ALG13
MDELAQLIRDARITVTHGGVGSVLLSLENGKRPVVVPRLAAYAETVDDHQLESARRFARAGLVTLVEDPAELPDTIAALDCTISAPSGRPNPLVTEIRQYLGQTLGPPRVTLS